jgi:hypothetical protein
LTVIVFERMTDPFGPFRTFMERHSVIYYLLEVQDLFNCLLSFADNSWMRTLIDILVFPGSLYKFSEDFSHQTKDLFLLSDQIRIFELVDM